ncbi:MAG: xanthine dehydrogenase family protein molybdopterin-binding subunit [Alphaproteobacteria bacterium]|nr:xanthine dehydrogenase family protein molybdopterin-binding subunit [Alphaproteobacteria bacterium]
MRSEPVPPSRFGLGQSVRRVEDQRFLTGHGRFVDDFQFAGQVHAQVLRSPHAHAEIRGIDVTAATELSGVVAVLTGDELAADGIAVIPPGATAQNRDGSDMFVPPRPALAQGRVRHVGEPVAVVVAESIEIARDATELIEVDYETLPAVTDTGSAMDPGAPQLYEGAPRNQCLDWEKGDRAATEAAFAAAAHVSSLELVNSRVVVNPVEPRACIGLWDADGGSFTLYNSGQAAHNVARTLATAVFQLPMERLRVISPDVGGGFGTKNFIYPEQVLVLWAARRLGRPVRWTAQRTEGFLSDTQGRDHVMRAELALDGDGRFLALRIVTTANIGAYVSTFGAMIPTNPVAVVLGGTYDIPAVHYHVREVLTNTVPVDAYRGAGRPEAAYAIERLVDLAAAELGLDPVALRRRNFIRPKAMPYKTAMGSVLDCGEFARVLDRALGQADAAGFAARRAESERRGRLRGLGVASYFEATLGPPNERSAVRFEEDGTVTILVGTMSNGQGHETTYAQILHQRLGLPFEAIRFVQGDTGAIPSGFGHGGSRSMQIGGNALLLAADLIEEKAKRIAAHHFEAQEADIELASGACRVVGTDLAVDLMDLAKIARDPSRLPEGMAPGLDAAGDYAREATTFPNGAHIAEVEIEPETGVVHLRAYHVVDDFGTVLNPMITMGQVHGGVAQGIGQALMEHTVYEGETGQLLSGSFMDYCVPRADDMPTLEVAFEAVPTKTNALGVKGCGEAGCIGALPAVINAVVDALKPLGIRHIDMPATPERVWRAIRAATSGD